MGNSTNDAELEWIRVREEVGLGPADALHNETFKEKMKRKFSENPFIPIGAALTIAALGRGLWHMQTGNAKKSQVMMRGRILAQGFTVLALVAGVFIASQKSLKK
ncbi:HIG1 domain family member 2A, mitochondrial-like [Artemia franciscana]|uniref:HIG1 domain family member 2A, mitochondrial-like n=1 Tax=Artemia franciscana TaxID=6661 RepID=UPI0032DAB57A